MGAVAKLIVLGRGAERRDVDLPGTVRTEGRAIDVTIHDLSATGFLASLEEILKIGDEVTIGSPGFGLALARVVRADGTRHGFEFFRPLTRELVETAGEIDNVRHVDFGAPSFRKTTFVVTDWEVEPTVRKLPIALRVGLILGSSAFLWTLILAVVWIL